MNPNEAVIEDFRGFAGSTYYLNLPNGESIRLYEGPQNGTEAEIIARAETVLRDRNINLEVNRKMKWGGTL